MDLRLYDTLTRTVRPLQQAAPGHVGLYVCGPTVQSGPHVGHLRSGVAMDVLHRWLLASGQQVTFVRNVTDVDDKIIVNAATTGEPFWALATRVTRAFTQAYDAVHVLPPTVEPTVTGHLPQIRDLIEALVDAGKAYASDGDVYLSVRADPSYGVLSNQRPDALQSTDPGTAKRDPLDFALWKGAKPGEPSWPSPWGPGRPGWHIECSAMAVAYLGETFDLHGGGLDLVFPHHENELAQSCLAGHGFARHWVHHGLVTAAGGEKMSKSVGNYVTVDDALAASPAPVVRYALGAAHYRSTIEWSDAVVTDATGAWERITTFVRNAAVLTGPVEPARGPRWADFAAAMDDDLAVSRALAVVHESIRTGNTQLAAGDRAGLAQTLADVRAMLGVLALDPASWADGAGSVVVDDLVRLAVDARAQARERKDWAQADALRDQLAAAGVVLEDTPGGVRWRLT